jgi:hypothetical protein
MKSRRNSNPPLRYSGGLSDSELQDMDADIDSHPVTQDQDDFDWVASVPGRPPPYTTTWNLVYGKRKARPKGGYTVACEEGAAIGSGCSGTIEMNSQCQELNAQSTPKGRLQKPPVCHVIPWAMLSYAMTQHKSPQVQNASDGFKRFVCWGSTNNLRTGHNGCNSQQTKTTVQNHTSSDLKSAMSFIDHAVLEYRVQYNTSPDF